MMIMLVKILIYVIFYYIKTEYDIRQLLIFDQYKEEGVNKSMLLIIYLSSL